MTIQQPTESIYKEKGSKFISFAIPLSSEAEIRTHLEELKTKYYDARHHCYAWIHGLSDQKWRANDDGEPSHSAGDPILGQIRSHELTNVLVVVVRYFGGTKLGVGGLINAYKLAASQALEKAKKVILIERVRLTIAFDYDQMSTVERLISEFEMIAERVYEERCLVRAQLAKADLSRFMEMTQEMYNIKIEIES